MISDFLNISKWTSPYRSKLIVKHFKPWLRQRQKVLDIGCGTGITTEAIADNLKVDIACCDVENYLISGISVPFHKISKRGNFPFKDEMFEVAMLNDVLHHVDKPYQIHLIKEALRVAKKVLIFEAEPTLSAKFFDTLLNKFHYAFLDAPLTFRSGKDWEELFHLLGLRCRIKKVERPFWYPFSHIAILLERAAKDK